MCHVMSVWIVGSQYNSTSSVSATSVGVCLYHFSELSSPWFLQNCQCCTTFLSFPVHDSYKTMSFFNCFWVSLGQPLTRYITVSVFVPHNLHLGETGCLSIFALIALVLSACSWAVNNIPSISFFKTHSSSWKPVCNVPGFL